MKIQYSIFLTIIVIIVPILIISGGFSFWIAEREITKEILEELAIITNLKKEMISEIISRNHERLDGITSRTQLRLSLESYVESPNLQDQDKIKQILEDAKFSIPDISELYIIDSNGLVLFSTNEKILGKSFVNSPIFRNSHYENKVNVNYDLNRELNLQLSGPLRLNDDFLGVMVMETKGDLLHQFSQLDFTSAPEGEIILAKKNEHGDIIVITPLRYDDSSTLVIPKENLHLPIVHSVMQHQGLFPDSIDYHGEKIFAATKFIEETGWGLTIHLHKNEVLEPLNYIQLVIFISVIIAVSVAVLGSWIVSNSISKPIKKLQFSTKEISKGKLKEKIEISGSNEIRTLALDVNEMQKNLAEAQKNLVKNERFSAIGELSSRLAHDIRNPLSVIKTAVNVMRQTSKILDEKELKKLDMIDNAASKIKYLVENVLDFVRSQDPKYEMVSLQEILENARNSIHEPKNIKIFIPSNEIKLICDPNQIEIVFENIITNSIQAIGDNLGSITVSCYEEMEDLVILIQDTGKGIPEDMISKIFDPLFTTKIKGTGLGLASCKSIIESHKGKLEAFNNPTTFRITLPKNPGD